MNTERTTYFLMANLGSEFARFFALQKRGDLQNARESANRALGIINQLIAHENIGTGKMEIEILRNIIEDALSDSSKYTIKEEDLNSYFIPFAEKSLAI